MAIHCEDCGKEKLSDVGTCCKHCARKKAWADGMKPFRGKLEQHPRWKGGKPYKGHRGYMIYGSGPHDGKREHVVIAEKILGRRLKPGEVVHHWNGIKNDNRHCNLLICTQSYHRWIHSEMARRWQVEHFQ